MQSRTPKVLAAAGLLLCSATLALGGCVRTPVHTDPLNVNGRDGGGPPLTYPALMRIGDAAREAGDFANAVNLYRRAIQLAPRDPVPFVALGGVLLRMGETNEALLAFNSALGRDPKNLAALRGQAEAYLKTGRPELALAPLGKALALQPNDPQLMLLLGVTKDQTGRHEEAQAIYRRARLIAPADPALAIDLALSLTLSGDYDGAIAVLAPVATAPSATAQERQTLSLIYGLAGDRADAARLGRVDLDEASVEHNLAYFATLRQLSPEARDRAILSLGKTGAGAS
ncbi:MAG: tetratricopeptide repeat protein [Stellaceae bacterium]